MEHLIKPRIITMAGHEIAGYHSNLQAGFDILGVDNYYYFERTHAFYKHKKKRFYREQLITKISELIFNPNNKKLTKIALFGILFPLLLSIKLLLFIHFIKRYDVFIFTGNYSYLGGYIDRFLLKALNKITIDIALGSEARPPYLNGNCMEVPLHKLKKYILIKKRKTRLKARFTTYLIDHPTFSQFNTRPYIPVLYMGLPFYMPPMASKKQRRQKPLILHAPSNPKIKGTSLIRDVIKELKDEGKYEFDYQELINVPHSEVLEKIQECNFIINQMYSDTLMSGLDTEAAWFGKPSIVGGYNLEMVESTIDQYDVPPTHRIQPTKEALKLAIIHLLSDQSYTKNLGRQAQSFVKKNWSADVVAQKYLNLIKGDIPVSYFRSPYNDLDIFGCGINENDRIKLIKSLTEAFGLDCLQINDKPEILEKIKEKCLL